MLHHISDDAGLSSLGRWRIKQKTFTLFLDHLESNRYKTITFDDITDDSYDTKKKVVITFDDCPRHLWDFAIPELKRRSMKAVFYMPTKYIGGKNDWDIEEGRAGVELMTASEIRSLTEEGMEVGSHTHSHVEYQYKSQEFAYNEISKSKQLLEEVTGKQVNTIAYPYGSLPKGYKTICKKLSFKYGLSVFTPIENRYALRRWILDDEDTIHSIKEKMSAAYQRKRVWSDLSCIWSKQLTREMYRAYSRMKGNS